MNRREFVGSAVAGAALLARGAGVLAAETKYDLMIKGGRVMDPSVRLDARPRHRYRGGRIVAIEAKPSRRPAETLDARGKLVVPGLIDIHTHAARDKAGPPMCLARRRNGLDRRGLGRRRRHRARRSRSQRARRRPGRMLINIGRTGIIPEGDT